MCDWSTGEAVCEPAIDLTALRKAILQFRPRLRAVVVNSGGPIHQSHIYLDRFVNIVLRTNDKSKR